MSRKDPEITPHPVPASLRVDYTQGALDESAMAPEPIAQFDRWFNDAIEAGVPEPNAMSLATVGADGAPSARVVLLKDYDAAGFTFFTNYDSRKGMDLGANPRVAAVFYWQPLERQVRIEGTVARVAQQESEAYFRTRPLEAQIGAWASEQSRPIASRQALAARFDEVQKRFAGQAVPLPPFWGGYRIAPQMVEFWQGRGGRLHDRLVYQRQGSQWMLRRLSP